jgi:undecaprenyl-diphosphatase
MSLNTSLFLLINASHIPDPITLNIVRAVAELPLWFIPLVLGLLWGKKENRQIVLTSILCALLSVLINVTIGHIWPMPRPFVVGIGHTLVPHAASASFPSDHAVLTWSVAFTMLMESRLRKIGILLSVAGLAVAWARVYIGVHFPVDMLGALVVAAVSAWVVTRLQLVQRFTNARKQS